MLNQVTAILHQPIYLVDGTRTPFLKARNQLGPFTSADLAVAAGKSLLTRLPIKASDFDSVILGSTMPSADEANIARVVALRLGCGNKMPAFTVQRNCASGMQALCNAMQMIAVQDAELVLAGGTDAMSHAPVLFNESMVQWLGQWSAAKTLKQKLIVASRFRPQYLAPVLALLRGLTDPIVGLSMGQTAENLAYQFQITRPEMDNYAVKSHLKVIAAQKQGFLNELIDLVSYTGQFYQTDDGVRADANLEKLASLKPFFDKKYGNVTAGNSSQITDGAVILALASEKAVRQYKLPVLAKITGYQWAGVDPASMGLGPVHAATPLLLRHGLKLEDIDYWEINEAFAAQVLACVKAWASADYCKQALGLNEAFGTIPKEKLNIDGGAIALGHPLGASGARIVLHLAHILKRTHARRGVAAICIGGGQGGAMLIENVN